MQFKRSLSICTKWANKLKVHFWLKRYCSKFVLTSAFICLQPTFYFNMETKLWRHILFSSTFSSSILFQDRKKNTSVITGNILITIIRFGRYHLLASSQHFAFIVVLKYVICLFQIIYLSILTTFTLRITFLDR